MPTTPLSACKRSRCPARAVPGSHFCAAHSREAAVELASRREPDNRPSACRRGYDARWRAVRRMILAASPLCEDCLAAGLTVAATEVHHVEPLAGGGVHSDANLMSLCHACHGRRTWAERRNSG